MSDPEAPPAGSLAAFADEFAAKAGWPSMTTRVPSSASEVAGDPDGELRRMIEDAPGGTVAWWLRAAETWLAAGHSLVAERCAGETRRLIAGGQDATWQQLQALVAVATAARTASAIVPARPGQSVALRPETPFARHRRISAALTRPAAGAEEESRMSAADRVTQGLLGREAAPGDLAASWYELGEYQIVVEQFLIELHQRGLSSIRGKQLEHLVWCGRALLRLGDRISAYACFRIAVDVVPPEESNRRPEVDVRAKLLTRVVGYLETLADADVLLPTAVGCNEAFKYGSALAYWLLRHGLAGLVPRSTTAALNGPLYGRPAGHLRQLAWAGHRNGWFMPAVLSGQHENRSRDHAALTREIRMDRAGMPAPLPAPPRRPRRGHRPSPIARRPIPLPGPLGQRPGRTSGDEIADPSRREPTRTPIGIGADGQDASLALAPGNRVLALGPPFGSDFLHATGERLAVAGWTVVLVGVEAGRSADSSGRWSKVQSTDPTGGTASSWLDELSRVEPLRRRVGDQLVALRPGCPDPAARACVDRLLAGLGDAKLARAISRQDETESRTQATIVVERAAGLVFDAVRDLRRAAVLLDYVRGAMQDLGRALSVKMEMAPTMVGLNRLARIEINPNDPVAGALRLTTCVGSLIDMTATARAAEREQSEEAERAFLDAPLTFTKRDTPDRPPRSRPPAAGRRSSQLPDPFDITDEPGQRPWPDTFGARGPLCVLVDGAVGVDWSWLRARDERYAVVSAARKPAVDTLSVCSAFDEFLIGSLSEEERTLFEVAATTTVPAAATEDLGSVGAVQLRRGRAPATARRLVIWPDAGPGGGS